MPPEIATSDTKTALARKSPLIHAPLFIAFLCVAFGTAIREYLSGPWSYVLFTELTIVALLGYWSLGQRKRMDLILIVLCCSMMFAGIALHEMKLAEAAIMTDACPATDRWQPVHLQGHVVGLPAFRTDKSPAAKAKVAKSGNEDDAWLTAINVRYDRLFMTEIDGQRALNSRGIVRLIVPGRHRDFVPGDAVDCYVSWRKIMPPSNPGEMNMVERFRQEGIVAQGKAKSVVQIVKTGQNQYWNINRYLGRFAMAGDAAFHRYVPFDQAELASALVLGQRDQIEWKISESLLETGTIHMLAISGLHVDMVAMSIGIVCLFFRIPMRTTLVIVAVTIVGYSFLCGANAPVLRAMTYVILVAVARLIGLPFNAYNLLFAAALCLLAVKSDYLWDTGTQLSFLAVAVLIYLAQRTKEQAADPLDELIHASDTWWQALMRSIKDRSIKDLKTSSWVWFITTPIVLSMFHVVSPVAMVMNLLLFFPLLIGLLSGLGVLVFGNLVPLVAWVCGWICGASLAFSEWAIHRASELPMSHWWLPSPPMWWVIGFYALLTICLLLRGFQSARRRQVTVGLVAYFALGCVPWAGLLPQPLVDRYIYFDAANRDNLKLSLNFIDVGHGTSVIAQMPNGENWLYDAGRMGDPDRAFYPIANTLWHLHIARIDRLFLSHADADHYNAIAALAKRFSIENFYTTTQVMSSDEPSLQRLITELKQQYIPINILSLGDNFIAGNAHCTILHPDDKPTYGSDNADSLTMLLECDNRRFLLPGDLEGAGIARLLQEPMSKLDVMMAPHHGSVSQNPKPILGWGKPDHVVISGGSRANRIEVLNAFSQNMRSVWLTARDHALRVELTNSGEIIWKQWHIDDWKIIELVPVAETNEEDDEGIETTTF